MNFDTFINPLPPTLALPAIFSSVWLFLRITKFLINDEIKDLLTLDRLVYAIGAACTLFVIYNHDVYGF